MANTTTSLPKPILEDVLPNIGTAAGANKVWCRDNSKITPADAFDEISTISSFNDHANIMKNLTDGNLSYTTPSNMDKIYTEAFPTLFMEKQLQPDVTNLLTADVTRDIYTKIGGIMQNVYTMNGLIDKVFSDTDFHASAQNPYNGNTDISFLRRALKSTYKRHFSKDEVVNIFELETPTSIRKPMPSPPIYTYDVRDGPAPGATSIYNPTTKKNEYSSYLTRIEASVGIYNDSKLYDKEILFSSIGINMRLDDTSIIEDAGTIGTLSIRGNTKIKANVYGSIIEKTAAEYARKLGLEMAVHSKMLTTFDESTRRYNKNVSSGFMITRDINKDINGLIIYYSLIIPRPYFKNELEATLRHIKEKKWNRDLDLPIRTMREAYEKDLAAINAGQPNPNNREMYIAISSSFNFFDLVRYIPIRNNIVTSNLITFLGFTFDTLNGVNGCQFNNNTDPEWEFGYPSEYANLKCILSPRNTEWAGKKISECVIPYSTIDYPKHIFDLISNINNQIDRSSIINNQKLVICSELGDDKLIFIVNMIVNTSNGKISFQTKEIQYNLLFPAKIINADTEVSGEFTVKKTIGTELMKVDPITNITTFFTKVGINQPSHEIEGLFNIDNLTYSLVRTFINDFKIAILSSNKISNAVINSGVTNDIKDDIQSETTTNTMFTIPLKQYMRLTTVYEPLSRTYRMNLLTAKVEAQFYVLAIQRVQAKIDENEFRIKFQIANVRELYIEKGKQEEIEMWIAIGSMILDLLVTCLEAYIGSLIDELNVILQALINDVIDQVISAIVDSVNFNELAIKDSDVIRNAMANVPEELEKGSEVCQYLIDEIYKFIGQLRIERQELEDELARLQSTLETYNGLNDAEKNNIKTNTKNNTTVLQEISLLRQELAFFNKILANKQIVNIPVYDASNNVIDYKKEERDNIWIGPNSKVPFVKLSIYNDDVSSNKLTNSTSISYFKEKYYSGSSLPQDISSYIVNVGSVSYTNGVYKNVYNTVTDTVMDPSSVEVIITVTNNAIKKIEVTKCNKMFYKGDPIQFNFDNKSITVIVPSNSEDIFIQNIFTDASKNTIFTDASKNILDTSSSVLYYINNVYLPKKAKELVAKNEQSKSLNKKSLQNAVLTSDVAAAAAAETARWFAENDKRLLEESLRYYNDVITTINGMQTGVSAGGFLGIGAGTEYTKKDEWEKAATPSLKYNGGNGNYGVFYWRALEEFSNADYTNGILQFGTKDSSTSSAFKNANTNSQTGKLKQYDTVDSLNKQILAKTNEISALKLTEAEANKDELLRVTELYILTNESHNKLRNIINNIWQLYAEPRYNKLAALENYTIYINLVDNEKSNTYAFNINILNSEDTLKPYIIVTSSTIDSTKYTVDVSYRDNFEAIMTQISGACELINYVTIIFKSNPYITINKEKTIEQQIHNDDLFASRFDCTSFITIDNLTDNIVVADELNPQWIGQSFDNIIMANSETTLSSIYNIMYESFIKDYAKIEYNRNYIVEYTVNGVSNICVLRYFQLATLNKITNKAELKEYRIYCKIKLDSLVDNAMNISGDSTLYGDFNVKPSLTDDSMFQIDTFNKNIINMSKVGIGTANPDTMLNITDTAMTDVLHMDLVIEQQLYTMKNMINGISYKTYPALVNFIITEASGYTLTDDYFYCYQLPDLSGGKMNAENITVLYHGGNMNWNSLTYADIIKKFPGSADQIINNILPENQHNLDNNFLYEGAMYTTTHAFNNGTKKSYHMVFRWRSKLCVLGTGSIIETYIQKNLNNKKTDDMIEYTDKQLKFMNYVKSKNNRRNRLLDTSGTEVDIHNKDKASAELASSMNALPSLSEHIDIYYVDSSNVSIHDVYVDDISNIRNYINNERNVIYDKYTMLGDVDKTYIRNKVYDMSIKNGKEKHVAFLNTLKTKYNNNLNNLNHNQVGFVVYNDQYNHYRSIYYINKILTSDTTYKMHIYSFHMKYNDYIGNTVNIHGDVLMEGGLSLVNTYNNKPHVTINPFNKYVGVNTSERFINYADLYTTTASIYNTPHNLIVSNDKYPNAVFDRIQESQALVTSGDYTYFGSYSGATIRRTSNLFLYDASFMNFVGLNNSTSVSFSFNNHNLIGGGKVPSLMSGDNWTTYKHYGPDVSFEVKDCSGTTTELGQLKMVIDKIDTNGNIQAGFGVQVVDANMGGESIDKNMKNLMYVNNDKRLFINDIVLGKKLLTVDTSYNLNWNNKTILVEDSAIVNLLAANKANLSGANFTGNVSVAGNFTVTGTTTTLSTTNLDISDSIITLSKGSPAGFAYDAGIVFNRGTDASNQAFGFINQNKKFTLGSTDASVDSINLNITPGTLIANLEGDVYGTLTGPTINRLDSSLNAITTTLNEKAVKSTVDASFSAINTTLESKVAKNAFDASFSVMAVKSAVDTSFSAVETMLSRKLDIFTNISTTRTLTQVGSYIIDTSNIILTLPTLQAPGQLITLYSGLTGANTYTLNNGAASANTTTISSGTVTLCISTGTSAGNWVVYSAGVLVIFE